MSYLNPWQHLLKLNQKLFEASVYQFIGAQRYWTGIFKYFADFWKPSFNAIRTFQYAPPSSTQDYIELFKFNQKLWQKGFSASIRATNRFHNRQLKEAWAAWFNTFMNPGKEDIADFMKRQSELMGRMLDYPKAIRDIKPEYGFDFENGNYLKVAETDRFILYQVFPLEEGVNVRENGKPVIIIPPYVLGPNILAFLPHEGKSYVHCFANQGIPTYIRIVKDIDTSPAVQTMTGEDDATDTQFFCEKVMARHGQAVTLNGFCQGGYIAMCSIISGKLDGLVDALITCVTPMDGTRSKSLMEYLESVPVQFRSLGYTIKRLPNGNRVIDGEIMSWVYKLKSMEDEAPLVAFYRDLEMLEKKPKVSKTAAAINYWLIYDRTDLPEAITKMSFDSYTVPVEKDGTLPIKLFGRKLNFKRLKEKGIHFLLCYAEKDNLVDKKAALAILDHIDAEVTIFPKGHGSIATSWALPTDCVIHNGNGSRNLLCSKIPDTQCSIQKCNHNNCRGPVRYQLDLEHNI